MSDLYTPQTGGFAPSLGSPTGYPSGQVGSGRRVTFVVDNHATQVMGADPWILSVFDQNTRFPTEFAKAIEGGWMPPEANPHGWDGWVRLLTKPKIKPPWVLTGLWPLLDHFARTYGYEVITHDTRERPELGFPELGAIPMRDYQQAAVDAGLKAGRGVYDMPPRSGKTRMMCELHRCIALPTLWTAPTSRIVTQTHEVIEGWFGKHYAYKLEGSANWREAAKHQVVVCTAATAVNLPQEFYDTRLMLAVDEWHHCFRGTTVVPTGTGLQEIQKIRVGDSVWSRGSSGLELKLVKHVWVRSSPDTLLRITTTAGVMDVTDEHKIYTPIGKVRAGDLRVGSEIQMLQMRESDQAQRTLRCSREVMPWTRHRVASLRQLWGRISKTLYRWASNNLSGPQFVYGSAGTRGGYGPEGQKHDVQETPFRSNERRQQPGEEASGSGKAARKDEGSDRSGYGGLRSWFRGQGYRDDHYRKRSQEGVGAFGFRERTQGVDWTTPGGWERDVVLSGLRFGGAKTRGGGGRHQPPESSRRGRSEGPLADQQWLGGHPYSSEGFTDRTVVVEGTVLSIETIAADCDSVYDLEVADNHNYFAEGHLVSNSASATYRKIFDMCRHIYFRYGMTGTFFRSGDDALAMQALLSRTIFKVEPQFLLDRKHLVPTRAVFLPVLAPRITDVPSPTFIAGHGKVGIHEHSYRNQLATYAAVTLWQYGRKVLVLVGTKKQGNMLAKMIAAYMPSTPHTEFNSVEFLSTDVTRKKQAKVLEAFLESDEVKILIGTSLLGEGVDLPSVDALVYARGEKAEVSLTQNIYRVCTALDGKTNAIVVDFADRHNAKLLKHSKSRLRTYWAEDTFTVHVLDDPHKFGAWLGKL